MRRGKVLINGAGGFLGSHTIQAFLEAGYEVRATDQPGFSLRDNERQGIETIYADLRDFGQACEVTHGVDAVVNVAGIFDFSKTYQELYAGNVLVTENMCRAALEVGVQKFVHIATIGVYGIPAYTPMDENGPKRPKNDYELTKKMGEDVVFQFQRFAGLPATSLRPGPIYGPRSRYIHNLMFASHSLMATASKPSGLLFDDGPLCHHVHVRDVARAAVLLAQLPRTVGNAYNCCDQTPLKWNHLMQVVAECVGYYPPKIVHWVQPAMTPILRLLMRAVPQKQFDRGNHRMKKAWTKVVERYALEPALVPRVERDMLGYLTGDHVYDTSALAGLGFTWEYPDTVAGLRETFQWLLESRWVPDLRAQPARAAA